MEAWDELFDEPVAPRAAISEHQAKYGTVEEPDLRSSTSEASGVPATKPIPAKRRIYTAEDVWQAEFDHKVHTLSEEQISTIFRCLHLNVVGGKVRVPDSRPLLAPYRASKDAIASATERAEGYMQKAFDTGGVQALFDGSWAASVVEAHENGDHYCIRKYTAEPMLLGNSKDVSAALLQDSLRKLGH